MDGKRHPSGYIHLSRWLSKTWNQQLNKDITRRREQSSKPYFTKSILVDRYGIDGLYWCKYLEVHTDKPLEGFLKAIPLPRD